AALPADPAEHLRRLQDVVLLHASLNDRDFIVFLISVGDRDRVSGRGPEKSPNRAGGYDRLDHDCLLQWLEAGNSLFLLLRSRLLRSGFLSSRLLSSFSHFGSSFR